MWAIHDGMGWWMLFGGFMMIVFWGAIIGLAAWAITRLTVGHTTRPEWDPLEVARMCYAKGGITREQVEEIEKTIYQYT